MSISRQNLSIVIVTFKSDDVIHQCIKSIDDQIRIIVIENSNNEKFKEEIEKEYKNVRCYLALKNLGMGPGNNL
ncbi:glycosyltransferase, partial [Candidatus Pelagibacter bacterium]|nr:glycosyltransferase [Candidatus Pelagibacter bacterium]